VRDCYPDEHHDHADDSAIDRRRLTSPYPTVVTVTTAHQIPSQVEGKSCVSTRASAEPPTTSAARVS